MVVVVEEEVVVGETEAIGRSVSMLRLKTSSLPVPSTWAKRAGWVGDHLMS